LPTFPINQHAVCAIFKSKLPFRRFHLAHTLVNHLADNLTLCKFRLTFLVRDAAFHLPYAADKLSFQLYLSLRLNPFSPFAEFQVNDTDKEEIEWFNTQMKQCLDEEEVEELIESVYRTDGL
jgi:hypothetical protein